MLTGFPPTSQLGLKGLPCRKTCLLDPFEHAVFT